MNINSKTQPGGVVLYVSNDLEFSRRSDLDISDDGIESCWIELARTAQKNVIIGCVYRYPKGNRELFHNTLQKQLEKQYQGMRGVGPWRLQREFIEI